MQQEQSEESPEAPAAEEQDDFPPVEESETICDTNPDELEEMSRAGPETVVEPAPAPVEETEPAPGPESMEMEHESTLQDNVPADVTEEVDQEPARERTPSPPPQQQQEPVTTPTSGGLSLKIKPPAVNPAGPPPTADITESAPVVDTPAPAPETAMEDPEDADNEGEKKEKGKKNKKKKKKKNRPEIWAREAQEAERRRKEEEERANSEVNDVEVEYVQEELELDPLDPMYRTFNKIFANFKLIDPKEAQALQEEEVRKPMFLISYLCFPLM